MIGRRWGTIALLGALLVGASALPARTEGDVAAPAVRIDGELTVTAAQEVAALAARRESATAVMVITRAELAELGGQTAADVLRRLPRLYFSGPPAVNKDVRQAGLDKEFQNVLINGLRPPGGGEKRELALDRIPVEQVERIEIHRLPTAAHDADAVAGLVDVILREPRGTSLSITVGSNYNDAAEGSGSKLALEIAHTIGPLALQAGGGSSREQRGNAKLVTDSGRREREAADEVVTTSVRSLNLPLVLRLGERDRLTLRPFASRVTEDKVKTRALSVLDTGVAKNRFDEDERKSSALESYDLAWERAFLRGGRLELRTSWSQHEEDKDKQTAQHSGPAAVFAKDVLEDERKTDRERVVAADLNLPLAGPWASQHLLTVGAKIRDKDRAVAKQLQEVDARGVVRDTSSPTDSYDLDETVSAIYVMDEAVLGRRLVLTPGLRVEWLRGDYVTTGGEAAADREVDWNPSLHARWRLSGRTQLRAAVGRSISRPAFKDKVPTRSVKPDKVEEGNPDLAAARSHDLELGMEQQWGERRLVAVGAFVKEIDGAIEKQQAGIDVLTGLPVVRPVNAGEATVRGAEVEARSDLGWLGLEELTVIGNYTWLASRVLDRASGRHRPLADQPERLGNLLLRWERGGSSVAVGLNYVGEKLNAADPTKAPKVESSFTQWDLSLSQRLGRGLALVASGVNLLDERRDKREGLRSEREEVGRTFHLAVRYGW